MCPTGLFSRTGWNVEFYELRMNSLERLSRPTPKDFQDAVYRRAASRAANYQLPREEVWSGISQTFG